MKLKLILSTCLVAISCCSAAVAELKCPTAADVQDGKFEGWTVLSKSNKYPRGHLDFPKGLKADNAWIGAHGSDTSYAIQCVYQNAEGGKVVLGKRVEKDGKVVTGDEAMKVYTFRVPVKPSANGGYKCKANLHPVFPADCDMVDVVQHHK